MSFHDFPPLSARRGAAALAMPALPHSRRLSSRRSRPSTGELPISPETWRRCAIIESITKPGAEIHNYQPTPRDIRRAQEPISSSGRTQPRALVRALLPEPPTCRASPSRMASSPWASPRGPYTASPTPMHWMFPPRDDLHRTIRTASRIRRRQCRHLPGERRRLQSHRSRQPSSRSRQNSPPSPKSGRWLVTSEGASPTRARIRPARPLPLAHQCRPAGHAAAGAQGHDAVRTNKIPVGSRKAPCTPTRAASRTRNRRQTAAFYMSTR